MNIVSLLELLVNGLFEAEDHVAKQHGLNLDDNKSFISKLIYVYESKQDSL